MIQTLLINDVSVWTGNASTGTELDISDTTLTEGDLAKSIEYRFNNSMSSRVFMIIFTMNDSSTKTLSDINP